MPPSSDRNEPVRSNSDTDRVSDVELLEIRLDDDLQRLEAKIDAAFDDLERQKGELDRRGSELEKRSHLVALRESKTRLQRRRIAEELRAKRAELASLLNDSHDPVADSAELLASRQQCEDLARELKLQRELAGEALNAAASMEGPQPSHSDVDSQRLIEQLQSDLESVRSEAEHWQAENARLFDQRDSAEEAGQAEIDRLTLQLESLAKECSRAEQASSSVKAGGPLPETEGPPEVSSNFDWEAQKRLLMQEMGDKNGTVQQSIQAVERSRVVIESGVAVSADEVEMLREQLSSLMNAIASAFGETAEGFDFAATLEAEREKVRELQQQWYDKLRESELEISVERAKLARETVKLDEAMRILEEKKLCGLNAPEEEDSTEKPASRGRWLARLGLSDKDE